MSDLKDDLMDIRGVGEATADAILDVLADHDTGEDSRMMEKAKTAAKNGNYREAAVWLQRSEG